jgi:hypothetical protein
MSVKYDDKYNFLRLRPVGSPTFEQLDTHTTAKLVYQDYVRRALGYKKPTLGCFHHLYMNTILVKVNEPVNIGGGLLKTTCIFAMEHEVQYEEDIQRSVQIPGIRTNNIHINERYNDTRELPINEWDYDFTTVTTREGSQAQISRVVKTEEFENERSFKLPQVTLREPTTITLTCKKRVSYGVTCAPMGRRITSPTSRSGFKGFTDAIQLPEKNPKTLIYGNADESLDEQIELLLKERKHPSSLSTSYIKPASGGRQITEYLSESSTPTFSDYFADDFVVYAESTQVEPVIGALNRYIDITHKPA